MADPISAISLAFAIPSLLEACIKLGRNINSTIDTCQNFGETKYQLLQEIRAHTALREQVLTFVLKYYDGLSGLTMNQIIMMLQRLQMLLLRAEDAIRKYSSRGQSSSALKRLAFGSYGVPEIRKLLREMKDWEQLIQAHLIVIAAEKNIDLNAPTASGAAESGAFPRSLPRICQVVPEQANMCSRAGGGPPGESDDKQLLPHSSLWQPAASKSVLLEYRPYLTEQNTESIKRLVAMLRHADPRQMHILTCKRATDRGVELEHQPGSARRTEMRRTRFELEFPVPEGYTKSTPRTLRSLLLDPRNEKGPRHPLEHRLRLALNMARAVLYVHSGGFVHKNIRPETIVILASDDEIEARGDFPLTVGEGFLVGFDLLRGDCDVSLMQGDYDLYKSLYRHPTRWGIFPDQRFSMLHDIYSLGVVMLEIGTWISLCSGDEDQLSGFHRKIRKQMLQGGPEEVHNRLIELADNDLRVHMGSAYAEVAVACLRCVEDRLLEGGEKDEASEVESEPMEAAFLDRVLQRLQNIQLSRN